MIKAIIFDLWNTLVYNNVKENPVRRTAKLFGMEANKDFSLRFEDAVERKRYDSVKESMEELCEKFGIEKNDEMIRELVKIWTPDPSEVGIFSDTMESLKSLRKTGVKLAILSNAFYYKTDLVMKTGLVDLFDVSCFSHDTKLIKPEIMSFIDTLQKLDIKPEEALMVGDSMNSDIIPAEKNGIKGVLIVRKENPNPQWKDAVKHANVIHSLKELEKFL